MSDVAGGNKEKKKIVGLRTFADDIKRVRSTQETASAPSAEQLEPPVPAPFEGKILPANQNDNLAAAVSGHLDDMDISSERKVPVPTPPPPPAPPKNKAEPVEIDKEATPDTADPVVIPPFHYIRASSPDDSNYDQEHTIPDKKDLERKKVVPKKVPNPVPTHTLGVETDVVPDHVASALSNKDGVFDTEEALMNVGEGSIVTDKKDRKFRLLPAIGKAISKWFGKKTEEIRESQKPEHTIKKSSRRKDVIQAAAKQAKQTPADDYQKVTERLSEVQRITDTKELQIKAQAEVPKPSWSSAEDGTEEVHEEAIESLEAAVDGKDTAEEKSLITEATAPVAAALPETLPPKPTPEVIKPIVQSPTPVPATPPRQEPTITQPTPEPLEAKPIPKPATPEPLPVSTATAKGYGEYRTKYGEEFSPKEDTFAESLPPAPETAPPETEQPKLKLNPVPNYRLDRAGRAIPHTSGTPYLTFAAVIMVAVVLGVGTSIWWFAGGEDDQLVVTETPTATANLSSQSLSGIALINNRTEFYQSLVEQSNNGGGADQEFYPTVGGEVIDPEIVFQTLRLQAPSSFARAIDSMTYGFSENQPFMVLKVVSFDNAFGGILAWENVMASDLAPLFGPAEPVTIIDSRVNNRDVRVLRRNDMTDKIVYGFIDKNTILIATDRNMYARIAAKLK